MANMAKPLGGSYHHVSPDAQRRIDLGQIRMGIVAETEGFEPSVPDLPVRRFSKPLVSATHPRLLCDWRRAPIAGKQPGCNAYSIGISSAVLTRLGAKATRLIARSLCAA